VKNNIFKENSKFKGDKSENIGARVMNLVALD
jgi:hypothetical protein